MGRWGLSILSVLVLAVVYSSAAENNHTTLQLLGFFPCLPTSNSPPPSQLFSDCDLMTLGSVELALEEVNTVLREHNCFQLNLTSKIMDDTPQDTVDQYRFLTAKKFLAKPLHGILGPSNEQAALDLSYIIGRLVNIIQVTYSVTDPRVKDNDQYPLLYSILPTELFLNRVRKEVLNHFGWRRVAIFSSNSIRHTMIAEDLVRLLLHNSTDRMNVNMLGSFTSTASALRILQEAKADDIRVFLPIISNDEVRALLCKAYHYGLTTSNHVWILPGIYRSHWWQLTEGDTSDCTNKVILEAINSTLFVDTLPFDISLAEAAKDLMLSVSERLNLPPFNFSEGYPSPLLHSKMFSAYDAVKLLALAWNDTITELMMERNASQCDELEVFMDPMKEPMLGPLLMENLMINAFHYTGFTLTGEPMLNDSGRGLVTQMFGDTERIVAVHYYDNKQRSHFTVCTNATGCGLSWKGGYQPTDGTGTTTTEKFNLTTFHVIFFILYSLLFIVGVSFSIITCICRTNKYLKARTPLFIIILNICCSCLAVSGMCYLVSSYIGLVELKNIEAISPLCSIGFLLLQMAYVTILATVLVKNWRIYRIFYNPHIKHRKNLSTTMLSLGIPAIVLPFMLASIIIYSFYPPKEAEDCVEANNCLCVNRLGMWNFFPFFYFLILCIGLIILGIANSQIQSFFCVEGQLANIVAIFFGLVGSTIFIMQLREIATKSMTNSFSKILLVNMVVSLSGFTFLIFINVPKIKLKKLNTSRRKSTTSNKLSENYLDKCDEIAKLKEQLELLV